MSSSAWLRAGRGRSSIGSTLRRSVRSHWFELINLHNLLALDSFLRQKHLARSPKESTWKIVSRTQTSMRFLIQAGSSNDIEWSNSVQKMGKSAKVVTRVQMDSKRWKFLADRSLEKASAATVRRFKHSMTHCSIRHWSGNGKLKPSWYNSSHSYKENT